ncbi:phosphotransferase system enzyme I (PtsI) [Clostridium acetobutylicum]|uniref:Phosphoenolpyruvate-protein phosphotransferase n=1 Tax=Clostridium acetobutylicum (strain ATCC 824 / DSM 792 / JCM 1419 / IAM 19013 / LMG 5710 / NBRC 13948 / NRRL B-527 / VKM B-1787 / 2291 / W) TaxID=272562 RepID=Q97EM3_CLOAB|nr:MULTISPECIES: phosphoenolpyruvate--protein phosphotransferase [Clostridium]AAK81027.1 Phosphoenolpyruvate-protein kinase (PTS system enzyme I) [Clostridium acetobutylicum ATCC 824]ADZ22130.1 Phosphoenolpyruvate-protein kinase (PTS system enzyme I) [Clostridium acetobutylicum EA 2018]AEI32684.1 phosphoenolpyruvate-protein kinase (PTS system enzyme I) [Clostridium acetobutylicum DSM 1731]AWV78562.1 phosphoenolpyruvate--protein phosphotransferase [Clostridium acetobutylicum]NOV87843.1 phosphot
MIKKGISASKGYAIGHVFIKADNEVKIVEKKISDIESEKARLQGAVEKAREQLTKIKEKAEKDLGADKAAVFESHMMFLDDPDFIGSAENIISDEMINAEKALENVMKNYVAIFEGIEDEYVKERIADVKDVGNRVLQNLAGNDMTSLADVDNNTVVVAHDLTPSDTAQLDKNRVIGFLTNIGGRTSHSAIMARTLEIPAVVGLQDIVESVKNGDTIVVDGAEGIAIINPDEATLKEYEAKKAEYEKKQEKLRELINVETRTKEGKRVEVCGNIGKAKDVEAVLQNGGDGVGLFRTEFLYMDRDQMPTEDEQFEAYKAVVEKMGEKPVVIRTLDIGGDKKLPYLPLPEEMNPFLGYRAIRLCLGRKDIFKIQLRALLRASVYGNLKIMFPMISSLEEFLSAKEVLKECMGELDKEGKKYNAKLETGIMVEIPAAAVNSEELAKYVDFFSIGTNDLIQYTLAADRMNEKVSYLYNPMHPAVLKLIKMTIQSAHKEGKWCGMCGEMAGDEKAIPTLVEYGLDEFSMSASSILTAKELIMKA